jgi:hypothetical protein
MEEYLGFLLAAIVLGVVTGIIGKWIAKKKGRSEGEGFWLGFLFSVVGLIIEGVLPAIAKPDPVRWSSRIDGQLFDAPAIDERPRRKCPFCAEMILAEASVCRYCQREVVVGKAMQGPSSNVLYPNESGAAQQRQDSPEISMEPPRPIEPSENPQGADPCSICNPSAANVHETGAEESTDEQRPPAKEPSSLLASSSDELSSQQTEQEVQAPAQTEQAEQTASKLACPSCGRMVSISDAFCFFCGKKLRT